MIPGLDPKKMQAMMKQMGIAQSDISAKKVIIETEGKNIIITEPSVTKINMQGQTNFQITGNIQEEEGPSEEEVESHTEEDISTIIEKTGRSKEEAQKALSDAEGDLTEALLNLD
jgi:nascent polypeptide-associated complex subunit alpha